MEIEIKRQENPKDVYFMKGYTTHRFSVMLHSEPNVYEIDDAAEALEEHEEVVKLQKEGEEVKTSGPYVSGAYNRLQVRIDVRVKD